MVITLPLALLDFLPVLFTGIGLAYIGRLVSSVLPAQGRIAFLGGILVLAGGLFRAIWKSLMAVSGGEADVNWMEDGLFVLMTPGYLLLAWSVWQALRAVDGRTTFSTWALPVGLILIMFLVSYSFLRVDPGSAMWERILLSMLVIATLCTGIFLIVLALRLKLVIASGLLLFNLLGIFAMNGLARLPVQSIAVHWMAEGINTLIWLAFAIGAFQIKRHWTSSDENTGHTQVAALPGTK